MAKDKAVPRPRKTGTRRGRRVGSPKLTPEVRRTILAYVEAGSFDYNAAEAAGISERTFRDWIRRGEGRHPTRRRTPELEGFANDVRQARARCRAVREIAVADSDPKFWLTHAARSKPGREGWTDPVEAPPEDEVASAPFEQTPEELAQTLRVLVKAGVIDPQPCEDPDCRCTHHGRSKDDEDTE